jgi:hypothetical protein
MALIKYFKKTRIQFIRLLVLVKWAGQMPTIQKCWVITLITIIVSYLILQQHLGPIK